MNILILISLVIAIQTNLVFLDDDKIPEYLSILASTKKYSGDIRAYTTDQMDLLYYIFDDEQIKDEMNDLVDNDDKIFRDPDSWHITTLYIGKDQSKTKSPIYKKFKEGVSVHWTVATVVYVPGKIICAPVFPDYSRDMIDNKFPHTSLYLGEYPAVECNSVLTAVFGLPEYKKLYDNGSLQDEDFTKIDIIEDLKVTLMSTGKTEVIEKVYFIKTDAHLPIAGVTKKNYSNRK
jgi:hypothetical protein